MKTGATAVTFSSKKDKFLIVKRSESKKSHPGMWEFPGGKVNPEEKPREAVIRELREETKLHGQVIRTGEKGAVRYQEGSYMIHPFLIMVDSGKVRLSKEHSEYEWIDIEDIEKYNTVPGIEEELRSLKLLKEPMKVVACVLKERYTDKILLMKRVQDIRLYSGKWEFPSGKIKKQEDPHDAAIRELKEETGQSLKPARKGAPVKLDTDYGPIEVHPFLFVTESDDIVKNWEHDRHEWIQISDVDNYETVPGLKRDLESLDIQ